MGYHKIFGRTYSKQGTLAKPLKKTETVAIVAALSALCVATSYAMLPLFNIKLMDAIVFVAGFAFGAMPGMAIALTAWLVYGTINPLGLSLPVLISVMFTETIYAIAGRVLSKNERVTSSQSLTELFIIFGAVGLLVTLAYDLITNAIFGCLFLGSVWAGLLTMNFPLPMGLIHEASNLILFALVVPLLIQAIKRYLLK